MKGILQGQSYSLNGRTCVGPMYVFTDYEVLSWGVTVISLNGETHSLT